MHDAMTIPPNKKKKKFPSPPPCCVGKEGDDLFCVAAASSNCCVSGTCTGTASFLPPELLLDPPPLPTDSSNAQIVRSTIRCSQICCSSEIPGVQNVLQSLGDGIQKTFINVPLKLVTVDHDVSILTATDIEAALNQARFGALIQQDGGADRVAATPTWVRSTLQYTNQPEETSPQDTVELLNNCLAVYSNTEMDSFVIDPSSNVISVAHNPLRLPLSEIVEHLRIESGISLRILSNGADEIVWGFPSYDEAAQKAEIGVGEDEKYPKPAVTLSGIFWVLSMFSILGGFCHYLQYVALLSVFFGMPGIALKAIASLQRCTFDTNCLMLFAAMGAVAIEEYTEAAAVTFLFAISEWLEGKATTRGRNALSAIVNLRPDFAYIVHPTTQQQMMIPASAVPVGAIVAVKTGDKIPCNGVVVEGISAVDESSLTGESKPVQKGPKSLVSGGTVNAGKNHLMIQTTSTADNSAISKLVNLVEEAQGNRSETEKLVDEFAKYYTPVVVLTAFGLCTIPWSYGPETGKLWMYNGLVLLVVACPCALIISTPVTYVAGLAATAQRGVLIKGGSHLEALGLTQTICFDKTGTLTQGSFALLAITTIGTQLTRKQVLEYLVLMEERANHPLALAIVDGARNEGVVSPRNVKVEHHEFLAGEGLVGKIGGKQVYVGNERLFRRLGLLDDIEDELENMVANWEAMAGTVGFMSIEGYGLVCAYCVADVIRREATEAMSDLKTNFGIKAHMLTGDNRDTAKAIGRVVGLEPENIHSELLPEEKLNFITNLKSSSKKRSVLTKLCSNQDLVCHVGDGVNDAPALAAADVGIAMGVGAALAMETADVTLLDSDLRKLVYSVNMGRRVIAKIKQNVAFCIIVKLLVLGFALVGDVALWAAIGSDVGAMIAVTLNSMLLLPSRKIDRDEMGDVANSSYRSQVSTASVGENRIAGLLGYAMERANNERDSLLPTTVRNGHGNSYGVF